MNKFLTIISAGALVGLSLGTVAQDLHFSQFYENAILRNPALTGIYSGDYKFGMDYRSQWGTVATPYNTVMVSAETRVMVDRNMGDYLSFGLVGTFDKAGTIAFTSTQLYPAIAFNKALDDQHYSYLSVGLTGGLINRSVNQSLMTFSSQYLNGMYLATNPTLENNSYKSFTNYDVGAGVSLNSSLDVNGRYNYYLGASAYHLNSPTEIFTGGDVTTKLPIKWQMSAGLTLPFTEAFGLSVEGNYSYEQPYTETIIGGMFVWRSIQPGLPSIFALHFGAFVRFNDSYIPTVKIDYKDLSFGFSHDVTTSSLATGVGAGANATEITIYVKGHYDHRKNPRDPLMCPRFEDNYNPQNTFH